MYRSVLEKVLDKYGIKYANIFDPQKGYRNEIWPIKTIDNKMINITFYKSEPGITDRINRSNSASEYLAKCGLPTRVRYDDRILKLENSNKIVNVCVYNYLPGSTIPWEAYTMKRIKLLGMTMSDMHFELSKMLVSNFPSVYDEYDQIIGRMMAYFSKETVIDAVSTKLRITVDIDRLNVYRRLLMELSDLPNQQVLHMDFVRGNILFEDAKISGILDLEKTSVGHSFVDIARTMAFLLVDCKYKAASKVQKYFLYSGYQKRGKNKDIGDDKTRNKLIEMFLFYDVYKFLIHNPYEALSLNEHYLRTRDMLVKFGVISYK